MLPRQILMSTCHVTLTVISGAEAFKRRLVSLLSTTGQEECKQEGLYTRLLGG